MKKINIALIISALLIGGISTQIFAQETIENPTYIVQPGENLTEIAQKFNVPINDLIGINNINNFDLITPGMALLIPGLEGISGVLTSDYVNIGESLTFLSRKHGIEMGLFTKLNPITSPNELFVGSNLVLPEKNESSDFLLSITSNEDKSLLDYAVLFQVNPWTIKKINYLDSNHTAIPGEALFINTHKQDFPASQNLQKFDTIELYPLPLVQGHTAVLRITTNTPVNINGNIGADKLVFFPDSDDHYVAIQGIHAMTEPGLIPLKIIFDFDNNESHRIEQMVLVKPGGYSKEDITVEQTTIDQEIIETEEKQIRSILEPRTPEKYWNAPFIFPVDGSLSDGTIGFSSYFGSRRSYNNGQLKSFHGGLDFAVVLNSLNIYAPAPGIVLFTGTMNVRGNTTFIDHGYGIVSGYGHQAEILVSPGEMVETGQLIGIIGKTGRVTGPHLHWEIWVNGVQVDPFDWINNNYP